MDGAGERAVETCENGSSPAGVLSDFGFGSDDSYAGHARNNLVVLVLRKCSVLYSHMPSIARPRSLVRALRHAVAMIDKWVLTPWLLGRSVDTKGLCATRWFFLHSLANLGVCLTALHSMRTVLSDPVHALDGGKYVDDSMFGVASSWPLTIINSVHVYHMLGGFKLSAADYFHHLVFIPTLGFPGQIFKWGPLSNWLAFFISGLPGGLDYFLLGLCKLGLVDPVRTAYTHHAGRPRHAMAHRSPAPRVRAAQIFEKRVNANMNTWIRVPGILFSVVLLYQAILLGHHIVPLWAAYLQLVLPAYNALYFGKQAVANYAVHYMLGLLGQDELIQARIEQRTSFTTGMEVMAWKDALGVPQRGS
jgi:hypothetical protein